MVTGPTGPGFSQNWSFLDSYHGLLLMRRPPTTMSAFSPRCDRFTDLDSNIWDMGAHKVICRAGGPCVFVEAGKKLAWIERLPGGATLKWKDIGTNRDVTDHAISM